MNPGAAVLDAASLPGRRPISPWLKVGLGAAVVLGMLVLGYVFGGGARSSRGALSVSDAKECLRAGANIYFNVTLGTEAYLRKMGEWDTAAGRAGHSQAFVVAATSHVGTIRHLELKERIFLSADGLRYPSAGAPLASSIHHNTYLVFFPRFGQDGRPLFERREGAFEVQIDGVDGIPLRRFAFSHPLTAAGSLKGWTQGLMLLGAVFAALLLACAPCYVASLSLGSMTMGSGWFLDRGSGGAALRAAMARRTLLLLATVVLGYMAVVVLVTELGLRPGDLRPAELIGGATLAGFGLFLASRLEALRSLASRVPGLRVMVGGSIDSGSSAAVGGSLAVICSVAGAPTLASSIILPVLVFLGLSDLKWALATVLAFLVVLSLPFFFIAMGLGEGLARAAARHQQRFLAANAALLVVLGSILMVNAERVAWLVALPMETAFRLLALVA